MLQVELLCYKGLIKKLRQLQQHFLKYCKIIIGNIILKKKRNQVCFITSIPGIISRTKKVSNKYLKFNYNYSKNMGMHSLK